MAKKDREGSTSEEREPEDIKVTDRRHFHLDGKLREGLHDETEDQGEAKAEASATESPTRPRESAGEGDGPSEGPNFERRPLDEPEGVDFTMLINGMAHPALIFLGEVPHPGTGKPEVNLDQARLQIDMLDMLRIKSRGNLTAEEEGLLDRMLYQLRMLYVSRSGKSDP